MKMNIPETLRKYKINERELACLLIYKSCKSKSFAWKQTIGIESKSPNVAVLAGQWFKNLNIQMFLYDNNVVDEEESVTNVTKSSDTKTDDKHKSTEEIKKEVEQTFGIITDVTSENIKQLFINELNCSKDPEKRAALLLKLSDTLELITPEETDLQTPTIYLPARCQSCTLKK